MKRVIRHNVWETNSSSVHSLVICKDGLERSKLPVDEDGYIITDFGNFGKYDMGITTYDQAMKLSYLATECYYLNNWDENIEESYGLDDNEINLINTLRSNNFSVEDYKNYIAEKAILEKIDGII